MAALSSIDEFDVCVVGGGEVSCGVLRSLSIHGFKSVMIAPEDALASSLTSQGNSGFLFQHRNFDEMSRFTDCGRAVYERLNVPHSALGDGDFVSYVEPWLLPIALATQATANGATIILNATVTQLESNNNGSWTVGLSDKNQIRAHLVINCAEVGSVMFELFRSKCLDQQSLEMIHQIQHFAIYGACGDVPSSPQDHTAVWMSAHGDIVVTSSETEDSQVTDAPGMAGKKEKASYSGSRLTSCTVNGTSTSGFIEWDSEAMIITVAGVLNPLHSSVGVGDHVVAMIKASPRHLTVSPLPDDQVLWPALPSLNELCASFAERNDGRVSLVGGGVHRVSHPLTRFGLSTRPPFLPISSLPALSTLIESIEQTSSLAFLKTALVASVLRGGYTNCLYLVKVPRQDEDAKWVVRKGADSLREDDDDPFFRVHRINRKTEHRCVTAAAAVGLTPAAHFDANANLLAQEYISEPETFDAQRVQDCLEECVDIVKKLHCTVPVESFERDPPFLLDAFKTCEHYRRVISGENPTGDATWSSLLPADIDKVMGAGQRIYEALMLHKERWPSVCCHNDLVVGNLVRGNLGSSPRRVYLIDFEYSALGDRCFDLANLCVNSDFDLENTQKVVDRYLLDNDFCSAEPKELLARIQLLKILSDLREAFWALGHGCLLGPLGEQDTESNGDAALPQTFYIDYFERHLERFRNSVWMAVGVESELTEDLMSWMGDAME